MSGDLSRILVVSRGAGARRVLASCKALGLETVAAFGEAEAEASYVEEADYDVFLGVGPTVWRDPGRIVAAAMDAGCDAIHVGYELVGQELDLTALATAANLALIGIDAARAADLLDRSRLLARADRVGATVVPTEVVAVGDDGIEAAARVGIPLVVASATGSAEVRVDHFGALGVALDRTGRPALLMHAGDRTRLVEVVVVGEKGGSPVVLGAVLAQPPIYELAPTRFPDVRHLAGELARELGFVGVGVARFWVTPDGTPWFVGFRPQVPAFLELVERLAAVDLLRVQHQLTTTGSAGWSSPPEVAGSGFLVELVAEGEGTVGSLPEGAVAGYAAGESVVAGGDPVLAKLVAVGVDRDRALEQMGARLAAVGEVGVRTNRDAAVAALR